MTTEPTTKKKRTRRKTAWVPNKKDCAFITEQIGKGITEGSLMNYFGVSTETWTRRKREYPELQEAILEGKRSDLELVQNEIRFLAFDRSNRQQVNAMRFYYEICHKKVERDKERREQKLLPSGVIFSPIDDE